jgi:hypothetical protein
LGETRIANPESRVARMKVSGVRGERTGFRCQVLGVRGRHRSKAKGPGDAEPLFLLGDLDGG